VKREERGIKGQDESRIVNWLSFKGVAVQPTLVSQYARKRG